MRKRLTLSLLLVCLTTVVVVAQPPAVVEAQTSAECGKLLPIDTTEGSTFIAGSAGAATAGSLGAAPGQVSPGGAVMGKGTSAAGYYVGAFLAGLAIGTCLLDASGTDPDYWLDWTWWDHSAAEAQDPALNTWKTSIQSNRQNCADLFAQYNGTPNPIYGLAAWTCRRVQYGEAQPINWRYGIPLTANATSGGVTVPKPTFTTKSYGPDRSTAANVFLWSPGVNSSVTCANFTTDFACTSTAATETVTMWRCETAVLGLSAVVVDAGGQCGIPPGYVLLGRPNSGTTQSFTPVVALDPDVINRGWQRRVVSVVQCTSGTVIEESPYYWDIDVTGGRVPVPVCPNGPTKQGKNAVPTKISVQRVPRNVPCDATMAFSTGGCWPDGKILEWSSPTTWTGTASPDWTVCLTGGMACGAPVLDNTTQTCTWGGYSVGANYCSPSRQVDPQTSTVPGQQLKTTPVQVLDPNAGVGPRTSTAPTGSTDPAPGGGGTGTATPPPIDSGSGPCAGVAGCVQSPDIGGGSNEECWPAGWGWFNPAQWVLRPIKCAMAWAFIPSDGFLLTWVTEVRTEFEASFPFSLLYVLADFTESLAADVATSSGCATLGMGGVASGVCMETDAVSLGANRSTIAAIVVSLLVLGIAQACVGLVVEK